MEKGNIITFIILMVISYLFFSFIIWDLNASHWHIGVRVVYGTICPLLIMFLISINNITK